MSTQGFFTASSRGFAAPDGKPAFVTGMNLWYGMHLGAPTPLGNRSRLDGELDTLKAAGINNLRVLASGEASPLQGSVSPALMEAPGVYNTALLEGLDYLLAGLAKRSMTAVLYLGNFWHWSGGFPRWNVWAAQASAHTAPGQEAQNLPDCASDLADPSNPQNRYQLCADSFYRNEQAIQLFENHIRFMVGRSNSITGRPYREDPTILAWQLANEPRGGEGSPRRSGYEAFKQWIKRSTQLIKELDPHHLVSTGNEGSIGCADLIEAWEAAHAIPQVDYLTIHIWPKNWGWWKAPSPQSPDFEDALKTVTQNTIQYLEDHLSIAQKLGKPLVLEEFGLGRDCESCSPEAGTLARDRYFQAVFDWIQTQIKGGRPMAGFNVWSWGGQARPDKGDGRTGNWFGDPPMEPQGLNSVFDCDHSTLKIIGAVAKA